MKTVSIGIAAITTLIATHAMAADMAVKAPLPAPAAAFSWTGCYVGVHGGYGWGRNNNEFGSVIDGGHPDHAFEDSDYSHHTNGGLAGVQYGCNTQGPSNWVFGIESEWFWTGMKGSFTTPEDGADPGTFSRLETKNRWDSTLAARIGYVVDRSLFYGKVGAAWGRFEYAESHDDFPNCHATCTFTDKEWEPGLMLGAGWEYAFYDNWSVKVEYDHIWFKTDSIDYPVNAPLQSFHATNSKDLIKVGLNYRFGSLLGLLGAK